MTDFNLIDWRISISNAFFLNFEYFIFKTSYFFKNFIPSIFTILFSYASNERENLLKNLYTSSLNFSSRPNYRPGQQPITARHLPTLWRHKFTDYELRILFFFQISNSNFKSFEYFPQLYFFRKIYLSKLFIYFISLSPPYFRSNRALHFKFCPRTNILFSIPIKFSPRVCLSKIQRDIL